MTYSFGISPQREVRQATELPQQPAALPAPAQPAREPQRVGGQLLYARQFEPDRATAQTIKAVENFVSENGTYQQATDLAFEAYKKEKKEQALRLFQQEAQALQQSTAIALDTQALQAKNEFALARQNRLSNPWVNFFYYDKKANVVADEVAIGLSGWSDKSVAKLAELPDQGEISAAITQKSQDLLKPYQDIPSAFVTGIIEPKIAATQKAIKKKVHLERLKIAEQRIISTGRTVFVGAMSNAAAFAKAGAGDPEVMQAASGLLLKGLQDTKTFLIDQNGYTERQANKIMLGYFDKLFLDSDGDGRNDIGNYLTADFILEAFSKVRTKDGNIPFTMIRDEETGESFAAALANQINGAFVLEEKRLAVKEATLRRAAKDWSRTQEQESLEWFRNNPGASNAAKSEAAEEHLERIRQNPKEWRATDKTWPEIEDDVRGLYKQSVRTLPSEQAAELRKQVESYNLRGLPLPPDLLDDLRDTDLEKEALASNAKAQVSYNDQQTTAARTKIATNLRSEIARRFSTHESVATAGKEGAQGKRKLDLAKNAGELASQHFDVDGIAYLDELIYEAKTRGEDIGSSQVQTRIYDDVNAYLERQRVYSDPTFYYNLQKSDGTKPFGARVTNIPSVGSQAKDQQGQWQIKVNSKDNLYTWSKIAQPVLSKDPNQAQEILKSSFIFEEPQLQEVLRALTTGDSSVLSKDTREVIANFRSAAGNSVSIADVLKRQGSQYKGFVPKGLNSLFDRNAKSLDAALTSYDAAPSKVLEPSDLTLKVTNWRHSHSRNKAVDVRLIRPGGQVGNNTFPSPVSGTVVEVADIEGYGNTVIVEVDRAGRGYNAGDRVLVAHGSRSLVKTGQKINVGEGLMLSGGVGTTTGRTTAPGVLHISILYPGTNDQISPLYQKPQSVQNSFIKSAVFPLIRRHDYPGQ